MNQVCLVVASGASYIRLAKMHRTLGAYPIAGPVPYLTDDPLECRRLLEGQTPARSVAVGPRRGEGRGTSDVFDGGNAPGVRIRRRDLIDMTVRHSTRTDDPPAHAVRSAMSHRLELLLAGSALVVVILSGARAAVFWPAAAYLNTTAGAWTGLANDFANGVFYRAPLGPDGYGGTRYFPLHVILHAGVMKVSADPVWSG